MPHPVRNLPSGGILELRLDELPCPIAGLLVGKAKLHQSLGVIVNLLNYGQGFPCPRRRFRFRFFGLVFSPLVGFFLT